jgi:hypothetical protein
VKLVASIKHRLTAIHQILVSKAPPRYKIIWVACSYSNSTFGHSSVSEARYPKPDEKLVSEILKIGNSLRELASGTRFGNSLLGTPFENSLQELHFDRQLGAVVQEKFLNNQMLF